jgi:alpha-galactosidase
MTDQSPEQLTVNTRAVPLPKGGMQLTGPEVTVDLPSPPLRYLVSGWQSWSLTAWVDAGQSLPPMRPSLMHPLQTDPLHVKDLRLNGSWYGAVELENGKIVFLGALGLDAHVWLEENRLIGRTGTKDGEWFLGAGTEDSLLQRYAELLGERFGRGRVQKPLRVWCSWYSLYNAIDETRLARVLADLGTLPFEVFQVDDGWQAAIGDWEANAKFPSGMQALADRIRSSGRTAGLWLAPLLVVPSSSIFREHRDWLLHGEAGNLVPAGFNWGEPLYALDTTHPDALAWLAELMRRVRGWGYEYAKLDFLYAGALPGKRHTDMPREAAYRQGLSVIREALGEAYFLTCGAPVLPSLGLCDGLRIGPDVAEAWASRRDDELLNNFTTPGARNAVRTVLHRLWLGPLVHTDPDVVYFRSRRNRLSAEERDLLQSLALVAGFKATSDVPAWMEPAERKALENYLQADPRIEKSGRYRYTIDGQQVDFAGWIDLPAAPGVLTRLLGSVAGWLGDRPWIHRLLWLHGQRSLKKKLKHNPV